MSGVDGRYTGYKSAERLLESAPFAPPGDDAGGTSREIQAADTAGTTPLRGAPVLDRPPSIDLSTLALAAEELTQLVGLLISDMHQRQGDVATQGVRINQVKLEDNNKRIQGKIDDWIRKTRDAESNTSGVLGWLKKFAGPAAALLAGVVAAAIAVGTFGLGAPVSIALMAAVIPVALTLGNNISEEEGGPDLSLSTWSAEGFSEMFQAFGMSREDAELAGRMASGAVVTIGALAGGLGSSSRLAMTAAVLMLSDPAFMGQFVGASAEYAGAGEEEIATATMVGTVVAALATAIGVAVVTGGTTAADAGKAVKMIMQTSQAVGMTGNMAGSGAAVGEGVIAMDRSRDEYAAAQAQAGQKKLEASNMLLQKLLEDFREQLKKVLEGIEKANSFITEVNASQAQTNKQLLSSLSPAHA